MVVVQCIQLDRAASASLGILQHEIEAIDVHEEIPLTSECSR